LTGHLGKGRVLDVRLDFKVRMSCIQHCNMVLHIWRKYRKR